MAGKRVNGEGSLYQRQSDGRWFGSVGFVDAAGRRKRKTVSARTQAAAATKLKDLIRELDDLAKEGLPPLDESATLEDVLGRWHQMIAATRRATTANNYRYMIEGHIVSFVLPNGQRFGAKRLSRVRFSDVDDLLEAKRKAGLAASTRRLIRSVLVQAINQAIKWRLVRRNEAAMSTPVPMTRTKSRAMTSAQAKAFIKAAGDVPLGVLFILMLKTGVRRGEALGLRWEDVDLRKGTIAVRQQLQRVNGALVCTEVKTERSRRSINLPATMIDLLKVHKAARARDRLECEAWVDTGLVFTTAHGTALDPRFVAKRFKTVCRKARIGTWHPHELRHTAATLMLIAGVPLNVVSEILGHASIRITSDVYGHVVAPQRKEAAEALDAVLAA